MFHPYESRVLLTHKIPVQVSLLLHYRLIKTEALEISFTVCALAHADIEDWQIAPDRTRGEDCQEITNSNQNIMER
jgi:hypothetical protein